MTSVLQTSKGPVNLEGVNFNTEETLAMDYENPFGADPRSSDMMTTKSASLESLASVVSFTIENLPVIVAGLVAIPTVVGQAADTVENIGKIHSATRKILGKLGKDKAEESKTGAYKEKPASGLKVQIKSEDLTNISVLIGAINGLISQTKALANQPSISVDEQVYKDLEDLSAQFNKLDQGETIWVDLASLVLAKKLGDSNLLGQKRQSVLETSLGEAINLIDIEANVSPILEEGNAPTGGQQKEDSTTVAAPETTPDQKPEQGGLSQQDEEIFKAFL